MPSPLRFAAALVAALALPGTALAGTLTLHPAGFGTQSYSSWKAQEGQPDDVGSKNQALYFQKMTATPTFAAGVAVIKDIAGMPLSALTGLAWDHREDGHCGAGAPRWNLTVQDAMQHSYTVFLGCIYAAHTQLAVTGPDSHGWCRDTFAGPDLASQISAQTTGAVGPLTIQGLAIVFDEGNDSANPMPGDCLQEQPLPNGYVDLDNIAVGVTDGVTQTVYCWTAADDNSNSLNGSEASCPSFPQAVEECPPDYFGVPPNCYPVAVASPVAVAVDPTDTELVNALNLAYPGVPLTSWLLYPYVVS